MAKSLLNHYIHFIDSIKAFENANLRLYNHKKSKKMYGNLVLTFLLIYQQKTKMSYRDFEDFANENNLAHMLCLRKIPHFTTLQKFADRTDKSVFESLLRRCKKLLNLKNINASIDGTGCRAFLLARHTFSFTKRYLVVKIQALITLKGSTVLALRILQKQ